MYILLCGYPPFNGATEEEIIARVIEGTYCIDDEDWEDISDSAKDLIQ
jgi:calcium-dependent protein kinase